MLKRSYLFFLVLGLWLVLSSCLPRTPESSGIIETTPQVTPSLTLAREIISTPTPTQQKGVGSSPSPGASWTSTRPAQVNATSLPLIATELAGIPTETPCIMKGGKIVSASYQSRVLKLPLEYRVYIPPCYEVNQEDRYPVLYLMHGQSFTDDQWDRMGVDEKSNRLIASGQIPELLIVMPRDRYGGQPSESQFGEVIVKELMPLIDRTYRTKPERLYRAVGGLSRGAGWSVHLAVNYWMLFSALGAHSPAIFYEDAQHMRDLLDAIPRSSLPRIFMDVGDKDRPEIMQAALWFEGLLNERDIPHEYHMFSGYHDEIYWKDHLEQYLLWYAADW